MSKRDNRPAPLVLYVPVSDASRQQKAPPPIGKLVCHELYTAFLPISCTPHTFTFAKA